MDIYEIRRENLRAIVKTRFKGRITGLAEAVDRAHSYLSRCLTENEKHRKNIGEEFARDIESRLKLQPLELDSWGGYVDSRSNIAPALQPTRTPRSYPLISWVIAGGWAESADNFHPGDADVWLESTENAGEHGFWLDVRGDSMSCNGNPNFPEGSRILVKPEADVISGKYYVVKLLDSGEQTFKQYVEDAGHRYLKPLNPNYRTIEINGNCHFIGRVIDTKMTGL